MPEPLRNPGRFNNPINDFFAEGGKIRVDGRIVHDMYRAVVKKLSESTSEWDPIKIKRTISGDEAFQPPSASTCPLSNAIDSMQTPKPSVMSSD